MFAERGVLMGRFEFEMPGDLFDGLGDRIDDIAPKMINAALPIYQKAIGKYLRQSISTSPEAVQRQTGDLVGSLGIKKAKQAKNGAYIGSIVFKGTDKKGSPNVIKAAGLEYGNSRQAPKPFLQKAVEECTKEVEEKMQEVFNSEVKS